MATLAVLALLHAVPLEPAQPQKLPRFAELVAAIGVDFRGDAFRPIGRLLGPEPTLLLHGWAPRKPDAKPYPSGVDSSCYMAWASRGVQCHLSDNIVDTIWLENKFDYDSKYHRNAAYAGELPDGLKLIDDAATVIRKMGPPEVPYKAIGPIPADEINPERTETWLQYPSRGLMVVTWKLPDAEEVIYHVKIERPRKVE